MGYESRIDIVIGFGTNHDYAENVATIQMCGCDSDFIGLFDKKERTWESGLDTRCVNGFKGDEGTTYSSIMSIDKKDAYGEKYRYTDDYQKVIGWLEKEFARCVAKGENPYRRYKLLYGTLKSIVQDDWGDDRTIYVVESGY